MRKLLFVITGLCLSVCASIVNAAPYEVLSNVSFTKKGGIDAVRIDFAIPVHYESHYPAKSGDNLTIKIRFDATEVPDTSELPLLQSLNAPIMDDVDVPFIDVTYLTENDQPLLVINFKKEVFFKVSQVMGITNLLIFLPETLPDDETDPVIAAPQLFEVPVPIGEGTEEDEKAKDLLNKGRRSIRKGKYKEAIQIFTALLSLPHNRYSESGLELLGVARERNNQVAHAKAIYEEYLEQYPESEGAIRVRQRLADLIAVQMKPKKRLKESETAKRAKKGYSSRVTGALSQYIDYSESSTDSFGRQVDQTSIDNQLAVNWRLKGDGWDVRNYFFGDYEIDTLTGESDGLEISSLYSQVRNGRDRYYMTLGRQLGSSAGVLGRFDGAYAGYDIRPRTRVNAVFGYPVDIFDKRSVQTNRPMLGFSVDFVGFQKGWDVSPYVIQQNVDGIVDRRAIGAETRYFDPRLNFFSIFDYDVYYEDVNIFTLQGQYLLQKKTAVTLNIDHRKTPLLGTSNAIIQTGSDFEIKDLLNGTADNRAYSADELRDIAADRTGYASAFSVGFSHAFTRRQQLTMDVTRLQQNSKTVNITEFPINVDDVLDTEATSDRIIQVDMSAQLVSSELFAKRDTTINTLRHFHNRSYDETTYIFNYRVPFKLAYRLEPRVIVRRRKNDSGETLLRTIPGLRFIYRQSQNLRLYSEFSYEWWKFGGDSRQEDLRILNFYVGYTWNFFQLD